MYRQRESWIKVLVGLRLGRFRRRTPPDTSTAARARVIRPEFLKKISTQLPEKSSNPKSFRVDLNPTHPTAMAPAP